MPGRRLGRSLSDLLDTIQHLEACGVDLYLDQQAIDTTTPMGKLVFQLTGAFAEFERTMIRQRIKAGLKRAVAQGVKLGRPKIDSATERKVRKQLAKGVGILTVSTLSQRNLGRSSLGSCVSCGRGPRALPCSSIPNSPLPILRSGMSQRSELRFRPLGGNSSSSRSAATAKSRPPLQRSSNVGLTRCSPGVLAGSCTPVGNELSR